VTCAQRCKLAFSVTMVMQEYLVMTNNANTLLIIAALPNNVNKLIDISLVRKL
jgi:hypothetical protein